MAIISTCVPRLKFEVASLPDSQARSHIDDQVQEARKLIGVLLSIRNEHSAISKVPHEVLAVILVEAVHDDRRVFSPVTWRRHIGLTLVCRFWRAVALDTRAFWVRVPFRPHKRLDEIVGRSRGLPLSLRWDVTGLPKGKGKRLIPMYYLPQLMTPERMQEFHLKADKKLLLEILDKFPTEAPKLRSLAIADAREPPLSIWPTRYLPRQVFLTSKPCLQSLALEGVHIIWNDVMNNGLFPTNLLSLRLTRLHPPPTEPHFYKIIRSSPNLEELVLTKAFPDITDLQNRPARFALPKLRILNLTGRVQALTFFYDTISHHSSTRIEFNILVQCRILEPGSYKTYISHLFDRLGISNRSPVRWYKRLVMMCNGPVTVLRLDNEGDSDIVPNPRAHFDFPKPKETIPPFNIAFHWPAETTIMELLHVRGVERLVLSCSRVLARSSRAEWIHMLEALPNVKHLQLITHAVQNVMAALGDYSSSFTTYRKRQKRTMVIAAKKAIRSHKIETNQLIIPIEEIEDMEFKQEEGKDIEMEDIETDGPRLPLNIDDAAFDDLMRSVGNAGCNGATTIITPTDIQQFMPRIKAVPQNPTHSLLLPRLESISIGRTQFDENMKACPKFKAMIDSLIDRANYAKPVRLEFRSCVKIEAKMYKMLKEVVGEDYISHGGESYVKAEMAKELVKEAEELQAMMDES